MRTFGPSTSARFDIALTALSCPDDGKPAHVILFGQAGIHRDKRKQLQLVSSGCGGLDLVMAVKQKVCQAPVFVVVAALVINGRLADVERADSNDMGRESRCNNSAN